MFDADSHDHKDHHENPHRDDDAHEFGTFGDNPGVEYNALRYLHTHSHLDGNTDTVADPIVHAHPHQHAGIRHGHEHTHGGGVVNHHHPDDHTTGPDQIPGDG